MGSDSRAFEPHCRSRLRGRDAGQGTAAGGTTRPYLDRPLYRGERRCVWGTTYPNFTIDDSQGNYFTFGAGQTANVVAVQGAGNSSFNNSGYIVGGHIGYNNQIDYAVFGVEADFDAFRPKGSSSFVGALPATATGLCTGGACTAFTFNNSSSANWLATLRGRFGVAVYNGLLYGTAGLAVTHMSFSSAFSMPPRRLRRSAAG